MGGWSFFVGLILRLLKTFPKPIHVILAIAILF